MLPNNSFYGGAKAFLPTLYRLVRGRENRLGSLLNFWNSGFIGHSHLRGCLALPFSRFFALLGAFS